MSLVSIAEVRALIKTPLDDTQLQQVVDRVESDITDVIGAPFVDGTTTIQEQIDTRNDCVLFTKRPITSVTTLTEFSSRSDTTGTVLTENTDFFVWPDEGKIERIGGGVLNPPSIGSIFAAPIPLDAAFVLGKFLSYVVIDYVPLDQRNRRKDVIIDLARMRLARSALMSESVAGEHSYTAPANWELEVRRAVKRLSFTEI